MNGQDAIGPIVMPLDNFAIICEILGENQSHITTGVS